MKIIGTGIDLVEVDRIRSIAKANPAFLKRVFSPEELSYSMKSKNRWERLAARFAAKEAVWKAIGRGGVSLIAISIRRLDNGKPEVDLAKLGLARSVRCVLSLSHTSRYAVAHCLIYR